MAQLNAKEIMTFYKMFHNYFESRKEKISMHSFGGNIEDERLVKIYISELEDAVELFKKIVPQDFGISEKKYVESIEEMKAWL